MVDSNDCRDHGHDLHPAQVTALLQLASEGDARAREELSRVVYGELHSLAEREMRAERRDHTLQPTVLVHEAWVRLLETPAGPAAGAEDGPWRNRGHFLATAAKAMRNVLVDHARRRRAQKRDASPTRLALDQALADYAARDLDVLALEEALERLAARDAELARLVELRFYGGLTVEETGAVLGLSVRQVEGAWVTARGWLQRELARGLA